MDNYEIVNNRGSYEVYCNGIFISAEDSYHDAEDAIEEHKCSKNPK